MLTPQQKQNINTLRKCNYSYGKIAEMVDASVDTIKKHCKRNDVKPLEQYVDQRNKVNVSVCQYCGKITVQKTLKPKLYCSDYCRVQSWREQNSLKTLQKNEERTGHSTQEEG